MKSMLPLLAVLLFTTNATAVPVNPNAPDAVAAVWLNDAWAWVLCTDGNVYRAHSSAAEWSLVEDNLPVEVSAMAEWSPYFIRTQTGEFWVGDPQVGSDSWQQMPAVECAGAVPAQRSNFGGVKGLFR